MLKRNVNYVLRRIAGEPYLLPYGQCIADHKKGIKINETGVVLWNLLGEQMNRQVLLEQFFEYYEAPEELHPEMQRDMDEFIALLLSYGILFDEEEKVVLAGAVSRFYKIGPVCLKIIAPETAFPKEFAPYEVSDCEVNLTIELKLEIPRTQETGSWLVRNEEITVFENKEQYLVQFLQSSQLLEARLSKDGSYADICYVPPCTEVFVEEFFHAVRFFYLYTAQKYGCFALHSASILYEGKAWLFSGHSGAGKSTHTDLWKTFFDAEILNGDLNLIGFQDDIPVTYGIPWCGTSGITQKRNYPLGGIILLKQAQKDKCVELTESEKVLLVQQRMISPMWTSKMLEQNIGCAERLANQVAICRLECTKEKAAAETMKTWIDRYLFLS